MGHLQNWLVLILAPFVIPPPTAVKYEKVEGTIVSLKLEKKIANAWSVALVTRPSTFGRRATGNTSSNVATAGWLPAHFSLVARDVANQLFHGRWIGRCGPVEWPAQSPDLNSLDFYLWGRLKNIVYQDRPTTRDDMKQRIRETCQSLDLAEVLGVTDSDRKRVRVCAAQNGRQFVKINDIVQFSGSIIGPILFNIFINDLPFRYIHGRSSHLYIYADDTALLAMGKTYRLASRRLQSILDHLQPWFHDWRIKVNVEKCQAILFSLRARLEDIPPPSTLFGREMPWMNQIKYLGIIMDSHLTFRDHIQSLLRKANGLIVRHYPILAALTPDNLRAGLTMYKALIRSVITYAAPAWGFAAVTHLLKLQVIQNQVIRLITHLPESPREESSMMN
ncbi:hypothetical protein ANN_10043 [Periplaneta americana]|uniref:Reverse transcriptase domain-containing protein n=1 Tax=Periplaneta americana TaxID=6978 RepID=A0ABQ8TMZ1_PERAM|nr:hypothetical protein ANN_10043 [Periplaneta americana]